MKKTCTKCGQNKNTSEFHRASGKPDGLQAHCRVCRAHGITDPDARVVYERVRNGKKQTVTRLVMAHGESRTPLYRRWKSMVQRCHRPESHNYRFYGAKGVVVCDEWRQDFLAFKRWADQSGYERHLEIDRINVEGPYSPDNCRWVTKRENIKMMRAGLPLALDQKLTTYAAKHGISRSMVVEEALAAYLK